MERLTPGIDIDEGVPRFIIIRRTAEKWQWCVEGHDTLHNSLTIEEIAAGAVINWDGKPLPLFQEVHAAVHLLKQTMKPFPDTALEERIVLQVRVVKEWYKTEEGGIAGDGVEWEPPCDKKNLALHRSAFDKEREWKTAQEWLLQRPRPVVDAILHELSVIFNDGEDTEAQQVHKVAKVMSLMKFQKFLPLASEEFYVSYVQEPFASLQEVPPSARTEAVCEAALAKNADNISSVPDSILTDAMYKRALKQHPKLLLYFKTWKKEDIEQACKQEPLLATQLPKEHRTPERITAALTVSVRSTLWHLVERHQQLQWKGEDEGEYPSFTPDQFQLVLAYLSNETERDDKAKSILVDFVWCMRPPMEEMTDELLMSICTLKAATLEDIPVTRQTPAFLRALVEKGGPRAIQCANQKALLCAMKEP